MTNELAYNLTEMRSSDISEAKRYFSKYSEIYRLRVAYNGKEGMIGVGWYKLYLKLNRPNQSSEVRIFLLKKIESYSITEVDSTHRVLKLWLRTGEIISFCFVGEDLKTLLKILSRIQYN